MLIQQARLRHKINIVTRSLILPESRGQRSHMPESGLQYYTIALFRFALTKYFVFDHERCSLECTLCSKSYNWSVLNSQLIIILLKKTCCLLEGNQNKNNCLVSNFYNKLKIPTLFLHLFRMKKRAENFILLQILLIRQLF